MKNTYQIEEEFIGDIPFLFVWGSAFSYEDLYELVGREQFMTTFAFKAGSEACCQFGESVTGLIYYTKEEFEEIETVVKEKLQTHVERISIDPYMENLTQAQREDLKYGDVSLKDIEYISFGKYKKGVERYESGEKKVPNVAYIAFDNDSKTDIDSIYQSYIISKNNNGTELIQFEKDKLVGITLAINDGHIDSRILKHLGISEDKLRTCCNIGYHFHKTKERRKSITEDEKISLADLEFIRLTKHLNLYCNELKKSGFSPDDIHENKRVFEIIKPALKDFEPDILLHGKKQVYWDLESYLHIVMRHVKQLQVGQNKDKTPFPYKYQDLETLIESVLSSIKDEIHRYFKENPEREFSRHGKMSVLFNEDYYCLKINKEGRLVAFHPR